MDLFTKNKFATLTIIALVILNFFTLGTLWIKHYAEPPFPPAPGFEKPRDVQRFLKSELDLNKEQFKKFEELRMQHFEQTRKITHDIQILKREMVGELFNANPDTMKLDSLADVIGRKQIELEKLFSRHFLDLKFVCGEDQRHKLRGLLREQFRRGERRMGSPQMKPGRGRRN